MNHAPAAVAAAAVRLRGGLLILAAAVLWSTSGFFAEAPLLAEWPAGVRGTVQAFWRALFAGLVLAPFVRRAEWSWRLIPLLVCFPVMNVTYLSSMALTTSANTIWLQYTAPVWVFLFGQWLLGERPRPRDWNLLAFAMAGVALILAFEIRGAQSLGALLGLLSGVAFAGVVLSIRWVRETDSAFLISLSHLVTAAVLAPVVLWIGVWPSAGQVAFLAGFGALQMALPYLLFARGLRTVPGNQASGILLVEPVLLPLWPYLAWRNAPEYQTPQWWTFAGGGLILLGLLARYFGHFARKNRSPSSDVSANH